MGWWEDLGIPDQPYMDPAVQSGGAQIGGGAAQGMPAPPMAGQFANNQQGFLDWATKQYGADPSRGAGFVDTRAHGGLQAMLNAYSQQTGNTGKFLGGPSGDRVDFGSGVQDALTSGGQIWNPAGGGGGPVRTGGGASPFPTYGGSGGGIDGMYGGGGMPDRLGSSGINLPNAPGFQNLQAPNPFSYQQFNLGNFQGPSPYQPPSPFQGSDVPQMQTLNYNPMGDPTKQNPIQIGDPEKLNYQTYNGTTMGPSAQNAYDWRFGQGQKATENALAHSGALRTGNAVKALADYGQGAASQEFAAEDARQRANVGMNNANAYQFGNANIQNQFNATQANNQNNLAFGNQNFNQAFQTNQANNQGNFQVGQANNQNALQQQAQQYGQGANTYAMNQGIQQGAQNQNFNQALAGYQTNLGAQNQGFNQALQGYQANANTGLAYGAQNQNNALANYQAQVAAQLGLGNLNLGYQNSNQNYNLGMGNLGVAQGQLGLQQQGQNWNQQFQTNNQNYQQQVMDPWQMNYQLAALGNPGQPNGQQYAGAVGDLYTQQGNAGAAGQVGGANAWGNALGNLGLSAQQLAYLRSLGQGGGGVGAG